jgi:NAD(P)-dependent dehydrogenase (short-subunit alcohol dehydrogenase family)
MGLVDGKVALVTGAGRGQGRSHAVRLASEGADVICVDVCADPLETLSYSLSSEADLDETIAQIEAAGRRAVKAVADVRSLSEMQQAAEAGLAELGKIDIVCANAGIGTWAVSWEMTEQQWSEMIDVNLTGVQHRPRGAAVDGGARRGRQPRPDELDCGPARVCQHRPLHGRQAWRDRADERARAGVRPTHIASGSTPCVRRPCGRPWSSTTRPSSCSLLTSRTPPRTTCARRSRA